MTNPPPGFREPVVVRRLDGERWELTAPLWYWSKAGDCFVVPEGFVTDFASAWVGRWSLLPRTALHAAASVLHDYLYRSAMVTRAQADALYREAMETEGISFIHRWKAYLGVRAFGWWAWRQHRKASA